MNRFLSFTAFVAGLAAIGWVGAGYVGTSVLALMMTVLIAAFYLTGALELRRFGQATATLSQALAQLPQSLPSLNDWLEQLHPTLREPVRLRIDGERVGLPGPALTPYLAGLLVLLGMLGTFLGMVVTLKGTGVALESAADLGAIRDSLSAPVKGLGLAFGTSVAGVAASAMLGLLSAWFRRERQQVVQQLDGQIATTLRVFSSAHQREQSFKLLQQQAELMPQLLERLQSWMDTMVRQDQSLSERLIADQTQFHQQTEAAYTRLAASVDQSLRQSLSDSARVAGETIQPLVQATLNGLSQEAASLQHTITDSVQRQLEGLTQQFGGATAQVTDIWTKALTEQRHHNQALSSELRDALGQFTGGFEQRSVALVDSVAQRLDHTLSTMADVSRETASLHQSATDHLQQQLGGLATQFDATTTRVAGLWQEALTEQQHTNQALSSELRGSLDQFSAGFEQRSVALVDSVAQRLDHTLSTMADVSRETASLHQSATDHLQQQLGGLATQFAAATTQVASLWQGALAEQQHTNQALSSELRETLGQFTGRFEQGSTALVDTLSARLSEAVGHVAETWRSALLQQERSSETLSQHTQHALTAAAATFEQQAASLLRTVELAQSEAQARQTTQDQQRLLAWTQSLEGMASVLRQEWQLAGGQAVQQLQQFSQTLVQTASDISAQAEAHAKNTIAEIAQLVQAASEAPRAAADVVAELRQQLSESMVRDNSLLEERSRILDTLSTLLEAVNHASTEQRAAIDALVTTSSDLMDRVGGRFSETLEAHTEKMNLAATQMTVNAAEVASLGEAFSLSVQLFNQSNDTLVTHLQRIEGALSKSMARSDEQLEYYVAQAREVIDLSISSQKQVIDDLQQLARQSAAASSEA